MPSDEGGDRSPGSARTSEDKSKVHSADGVILELGGKMVMGAIAFGNYHYPGSIFVEAMDNARSEGIPWIGEGPAVIEEPVDQCARIIAGGGMNNQTGRLVDDEDRFILEEDRQGDGFRQRPHWRGRGYLEFDPVPGFKSCASFRDHGVEFYIPAVNEFF